MKLYNREDPEYDAKPLNGSHHTLDYYKKSISYFMPMKESSWSPSDSTGNPTRSNEVNNLIKRIREFDDGGKKRKSGGSAQKPAPLSIPGSSAKKQRPALTPGYVPAAGVIQGRERAMMQSVLQQMHSQNESTLKLFNSLSQSLDRFKSELAQNNATIMNMINMSSSVSTPSQVAVSRVGTVEGMEEVGGTAAPAVAMLDWQYVHSDGVRRR